MPHAESDSYKMAAQVNGDTHSSAFLAHLASYPVISDGITTFKSNPYGAKSLLLTSSTYTKLSSSFSPYLTKPYQYVSPYVKRADSIGDSTLSTIDTKFPYVKKPTGEIYENGKSIVFFPLKKGNETKAYVLGTYKGEMKKVGGEGLVTYGKAAVATGLIVSGDTYNFILRFLSKKTAEAKEVTKEKTNN